MLLILLPLAPRVSSKTQSPAGTTPVAGESALDSDIVNRIAAINPDHIRDSIQTLAAFGTRSSCSDNSGHSPGIGAARDWLIKQFSALPGVHTSLGSFKTAACATSRTVHDVIAWIPGSGHPERLIVISGHYDSRTTNPRDGTSPAPGANDSGSQTALLLEAARVLAGGKFDATLVFGAWAGEEQGLQGSSAFVENYKAFFPGGTIEFNLNCDIVGGDNTANHGAALQQFRLFSPGTPREVSRNIMGSTDNTSPSRLLMHYIGEWGSRYVPDMTMLPNLREDRVLHGGDQESFIAEGIPGVRFVETQENPDHQHSPYDLPAYTTPEYTARIARVVVAVAASLARAPAPPQSFSANTTSGGGVHVQWSAPVTGPAVDHYVVVARPVRENLYHAHVIVAGSQNSAELRTREDLGIPAGEKFFVSVAAADAGGHESLAAYPEYRCELEKCSIPSGALKIKATQ